jgi:hypothetical protein
VRAEIASAIVFGVGVLAYFGSRLDIIKLPGQPLDPIVAAAGLVMAIRLTTYLRKKASTNG